MTTMTAVSKRNDPKLYAAQQCNNDRRKGDRFTRVMRMVKIERFDRVNIHIPGHDKVTIDGVVHLGKTEYFGAVTFIDDNGEWYVSFVRKTTKLWQLMREESPRQHSYIVAANFKEVRNPNEYGSTGRRVVITHVKIG